MGHGVWQREDINQIITHKCNYRLKDGTRTKQWEQKEHLNIITVFPPGENLFPVLFQLPEAAGIPWLVALSSIFKANHVTSICAFLLQSILSLITVRKVLAFEDPGDYIEFTQITQENLPMSRSIIISSKTLCLVTYSQILEIKTWIFWGRWGDGHYSVYHTEILTQVSQFSPVWKSFQWSFGGWGDDYGEWKKEAPQTLFSLEQDVSIRCSASQVTVVSGNKKRNSIPPWLMKISLSSTMDGWGTCRDGEEKPLPLLPTSVPREFPSQTESSFPLAQQ